MFFQLVLLLGQTILFGLMVVYVAREVTKIVSSYLDAPYFPTKRELFPLLANALSIRSGDIVYDLGCGDGRLLFYCAKHFPEANFVGVEKNPLLVWWMHLKKHFSRTSNLTIRADNIFTADISDATRIYVFLLKSTTDKLFSERKISGVRVVSRAFKLPERKAIEVLRLSPYDDRFNKHLAYVYEF